MFKILQHTHKKCYDIKKYGLGTFWVQEKNNHINQMIKAYQKDTNLQWKQIQSRPCIEPKKEFE